MDNLYFCLVSDRVGDTEDEIDISSGRLSEPLCVDEFAAFQLRQGFDGFAYFLLGEAQVVEVLEIEPKLRAGAEEVGEAESGVARDGARAMQNLRDAIGGHAELARKFGRAHVECLEFFGEVLARMNGSDWHGNSPNGSQQSPRAMAQARRPATRSKSAIDR
jgi:hypothetical protein